MSGPMTLGHLKDTHPRLSLKSVRILNALYRGGKHLLGDQRVMDAVFPRYANEKDASYNARRSFAYYENVLGQAINYIIAGLAQDPVALKGKKPDVQPEPAKGPDEKPAPQVLEAPLDPYWIDLQTNAMPPGTAKPSESFDARMRAMALNGVVTGFGWVLCDMPPAGDAASRLDQETSGALRAYPIPYNAENVLDWHEEDGSFLWVKTFSCSQPAPAPEKPREFWKHEWIVWETETWTRYELMLDDQNKDPSGKVWKDEDTVAPAEEPTAHSFGQVPWVLFDANPGDEPSLHLGDIMESAARSLFVQQNAEVFIRMRAHAQQLYEFLGTEIPGIDTPIPGAQKDENRAKPGQRRSPDTVEVRGKDDKAMFVAPNMDGVAATQKAIEDMRTGLMRVASQLALSQDTQGAMLRRSGDSKAQDKIAEEIILGAIGKKLLACVKQVVNLLAAGRGDDKPESIPDVKGYEAFSVDDADDVLNRLTLLSTITIESPNFWRWVKTEACFKLMGDNAPPEVKDAVRDDLQQNISDEMFRTESQAKLEMEKAKIEAAKNPAPAGGGFGQ